MASVYGLKPRFQNLLRPAVSRLAAAGVTANQVTAAAALGSFAVALAAAHWAAWRPVFVLLAAWFLVRMALNAIDGMLARDYGQKSRLGAYLNELGDILSDAAMYAPFALVAPFAAGPVGAVIVLAIATEFAGALGPMIGASRHYEGPLGKSDRAVVFGLLGLWIGVGGPLPGWLALLMPALAGLALLTVANRVRAGIAEAAARGAA